MSDSWYQFQQDGECPTLWWLPEPTDTRSVSKYLYSSTSHSASPMTFVEELSFLLSLSSSDVLLSRAAKNIHVRGNTVQKTMPLSPFCTNCKSSVISDVNTGSKELVSARVPTPKLAILWSLFLYLLYDWPRVPSFKSTSPDHSSCTDSCRPAETSQPSALIHHRMPGLESTALSRVAPYCKYNIILCTIYF